jgi:hypothetical protein
VDFRPFAAVVGSLACTALALGLGTLFAGVRLRWRDYAVLTAQLWGLLLAAGLGVFALLLRMGQGGAVQGESFKAAVAVLGAFVLIVAAFAWWQLRRLTRCPRWRALCAALLTALTLSTVIAGAGYFRLQAALPTTWDQLLAGSQLQELTQPVNQEDGPDQRLEEAEQTGAERSGMADVIYRRADEAQPVNAA